LSLSLGAILFYGGIAGLVISFILVILITAAQNNGRKQLKKKLDEEYGEVKKQ